MRKAPCKPLVVCKKCGIEYNHPRMLGANSSTSSLSKHLKSHKKKDAQLPKKDTRPLNEYFSSSTQRHQTLFESEFKELLLHTVVTCNWPFDQFDNPQFQELLSRGFPAHTLPGRNAMKAQLTKSAEEARADIKWRLAENQSHVSLALDCWTSPNRWEFMGIFSEL